MNNNSLAGVGYTLTLRPGVKLSLSGPVDGKNINTGGHKLGLGLGLGAPAPVVRLNRNMCGMLPQSCLSNEQLPS